MGAIYCVSLLEKSSLSPDDAIYATIAVAAARSIRESMQRGSKLRVYKRTRIAAGAVKAFSAVNGAP